jgi:two-component sensor histidine kinase
MALARSHALTLSHAHAGADAAKPTTLHALMRTITAPHEQEISGRFSITGSDVEISGDVISELALLLHEFATNAAKYGALSMAGGRVDIHCEEQAGRMSVTWSERGGPPVACPFGKEGFGGVLIRSTVKGLDGNIHNDWTPEGLVIRLTVPRERLTA